MAAPTAAGILFVCNGQVLLLKRSADAQDAPGVWGFPGGGGIESGEAPEQAARRELQEETGLLYDGPLRPLYVTPDGFQCFGAAVTTPLAPALNHEHTAAVWTPFDELPSPLHPGMSELVSVEPVQAQDSSAFDFLQAVDALHRYAMDCCAAGLA